MQPMTTPQIIDLIHYSYSGSDNMYRVHVGKYCVFTTSDEFERDLFGAKLICDLFKDTEALGKFDGNEVLDELEGMARQHCHTELVHRDYNGQVAGTMVTDSGATSSDAEALHMLAKHNRFRIVADHGRMVVGYWPENDPEKELKTS